MARRSRNTGVTLIELLIVMVVLGIVSTMLVQGWISLQKATVTLERTSNARATVRDATARVSSELRGAQPTALPTPTGATMPAPYPVLTQATEYSVTFYSAYNSGAANSDGSGLAAVRPTRIWLDVDTPQAAPWNPLCRTLYWQRDMNRNGSFADAGDRTIVLAMNVANKDVPDATNGSDYTPVFRYAYLSDGNIYWSDDADAFLSSIVGVRVRLIVDAKMGGTSKYIDTTTTVRLRNATSIDD